MIIALHCSFNISLFCCIDFLIFLSLHSVQFNSLMKEIDDGLIIEISHHIGNYTEVSHAWSEFLGGNNRESYKSKENNTPG